MCCMTMALESTTGESDKARPAPGIRCEGNRFSIESERNGDFRYGFLILCSLLDIAEACSTCQEVQSMLISAA